MSLLRSLFEVVAVAAVTVDTYRDDNNNDGKKCERNSSDENKDEYIPFCRRPLYDRNDDDY